VSKDVYGQTSRSEWSGRNSAESYAIIAGCSLPGPSFPQQMQTAEGWPFRQSGGLCAAGAQVRGRGYLLLPLRLNPPAPVLIMNPCRVPGAGQTHFCLVTSKAIPRWPGGSRTRRFQMKLPEARPPELLNLCETQ
jgi:hypothetical protein